MQTQCLDRIEGVRRQIKSVDAAIGNSFQNLQIYQDRLIALRGRYSPRDTEEAVYLFSQENQHLGDLYRIKRELEERREGFEWYLLSFP